MIVYYKVMNGTIREIKGYRATFNGDYVDIERYEDDSINIPIENIVKIQEY